MATISETKAIKVFKNDIINIIIWNEDHKKCKGVF